MAVLILCQMIIENKSTLASGTCHLYWIELLLLSKFPVWPVHGRGESSPQSQRGQKPITQLYGIATTSSNKPGCCSGHGKCARTCLNSALQSQSWEGLWYPAQRSDEEKEMWRERSGYHFSKYHPLNVLSLHETPWEAIMTHFLAENQCQSFWSATTVQCFSWGTKMFDIPIFSWHKERKP